MATYFYLSPFSPTVLRQKTLEHELSDSIHAQPYHFVYAEAALQFQKNISSITNSLIHSDRFAKDDGGVSFQLSPIQRLICLLMPNSSGSHRELAILFLSLLLNCLSFYFLALQLNFAPSLSALIGIGMGISPFALALARLDQSSIAFFHWPLFFMGLVSAVKQSRSKYMVSALLATSLLLVSTQNALTFIYFSWVPALYFLIQNKSRGSTVLVYFSFLIPALLNVYKFSQDFTGQMAFNSLEALPPFSRIHPLQLFAMDYVNGVYDINPFRATLSNLFLPTGWLPTYAVAGAGIRWIFWIALVGLSIKGYLKLSKSFFAVTTLLLVMIAFPKVFMVPLFISFFSKIFPNLLYNLPLWGVPSLGTVLLAPVLMLELSRAKPDWWNRLLALMDPLAVKVSWLSAFVLLFADFPPISGLVPYRSREVLEVSPRVQEVISIPHFVSTQTLDLPILLNQIRSKKYQVIGTLKEPSAVPLNVQILLSPELYEKNIVQIKKYLECLKPPAVIFPLNTMTPETCKQYGLEFATKFSCNFPGSNESVVDRERLKSCTIADLK